MPRARAAGRIVEVNMNPRGMVHEIGCKYVAARLRVDPAAASVYKTMPVGQVPPGKAHCSLC